MADPSTAEAQQPAARETVSLASAVDAIVDDGRVAYLPRSQRIVAVEGYSAEGDNRYRQANTIAVAGTRHALGPQAVASGDKDQWQPLKKQVTAALSKEEWRLLTRHAWAEPSRELVLAQPNVRITWRGRQLRLQDANRNEVPFVVQALPLFSIRPVAVHVHPDVSFVIVHFHFDPGSSYGQGYNFYDEYTVIKRPGGTAR